MKTEEKKDDKSDEKKDEKKDDKSDKKKDEKKTLFFSEPSKTRQQEVLLTVSIILAIGLTSIVTLPLIKW